MPGVTHHYAFTGLANTRCQVSAQRFTRLTSNYRAPDYTSNTHQIYQNASQLQLHCPEGGSALASMPEERKHLKFFRTRPTIFHGAWSKTFNTKKTSEAQSTKSETPTDPELDARVGAIKSTLKDMEPSIDAINNLIQIFRENGHYCDCCSPQKCNAGSCGSSCALLRPKGSDPGITAVILVTWARRATKTNGQYLRISREIQKAGDNPKADAISRWELDVADLQEVLTNRLEKAGADGLMPKEIKEVVGLDLEWTFDNAWKEKQAEVELAPDELPQ